MHPWFLAVLPALVAAVITSGCGDQAKRDQEARQAQLDSLRECQINLSSEIRQLRLASEQHTTDASRFARQGNKADADGARAGLLLRASESLRLAEMCVGSRLAAERQLLDVENEIVLLEEKP